MKSYAASRVAGTFHTGIVLAMLGAWAAASKFSADRVGLGGNPRHIPSYMLTIAFEWLLFTLVVWGVRRHGVAVQQIIGPRWHSFGAMLRDIAIAAGFWVVSLLVLSMFALLLPKGSANFVEALLPVGNTEIGLWIVVSISAGICEETVFRGYLQGQITALTNSVVAGILLPSAVFGVVHSSQGLRPAVLIALYGAMFGALAHWRRTVRPGMIAHAWNDAFAGLAQGLLR